MFNNSHLYLAIHICLALMAALEVAVVEGGNFEVAVVAAVLLALERVVEAAFVAALGTLAGLEISVVVFELATVAALQALASAALVAEAAVAMASMTT